MSDSVDRDFNIERPKTFLIRDEVFTLRTVRPEAWAAYLRESDLVQEGTETTLEQLWELRDRQILLSIVPDEHERWRELRARDENGVELADLDRIREWLQEVHTGRPTVQAQASSPGPGNGEASSTGRSSSPEVTRVA